MRTMRLLVSVLVSIWLASAVAYADGGWVVVSMRQYLTQGSSRIHMYLYAMDGTFNRALTDDHGFNDLDPVFSSDGQSVRFTREAADKAHQAEAGSYIVDIPGGGISRYNPVKDYFGSAACDQLSSAYGSDSQGWVNIDAGSYQSPDGKFKLQRTPVTAADDSGQYQIVAQGKEPVSLAGQPGFLPADQGSSSDCLQVCNAVPSSRTVPAWNCSLFPIILTAPMEVRCGGSILRRCGVPVSP